MAKMFDRATIECNDDGTFSLSVTPPPQEKKSGEPEVAMYGNEKRATLQSLGEIGAKIADLVGGKKEEKKPSDGEAMDDYMDGSKYTADKEEDSEK